MNAEFVIHHSVFIIQHLVMSLSAIILAAGKSTRMKSNKSKVLHEVCGKPMLDYVLRACYDAGVSRVMVVVGHAKEQVMDRFADDKRIVWVEQTEQLGTGHAAKMCADELKKHPGDVFILTGDGPMIRSEILRTLRDAHHADHAAASMATAVMDEPFGYGRIIRDDKGEFVDIIEEVDCTPEQREIAEVFPSYYCVKSDELLHALSLLKNTTNKKGEYYLTDIYGILRREGKKITAVQAVTQEDVLAVNTRQQLADVDLAMQDRIQRQHREAGVTIVSSLNCYIQTGCTIGPDTSIAPFSFIGCDSTIGRDCEIGPFAVIQANSIVPDGTTIAGDVGAYSRVNR
jgi:bifunctional UDP-N-acetylglucosamine pyrophosphorylase/glucosamine-1-phosphate N-acetyltransferase